MLDGGGAGPAGVGTQDISWLAKASGAQTIRGGLVGPLLSLPAAVGTFSVSKAACGRRRPGRLVEDAREVYLSDLGWVGGVEARGRLGSSMEVSWVPDFVLWDLHMSFRWLLPKSPW